MLPKGRAKHWGQRGDMDVGRNGPGRDPSLCKGRWVGTSTGLCLCVCWGGEREGCDCIKSLPSKDLSDSLCAQSQGHELEGAVRLGGPGLRATFKPGCCHFLAGELGPYLAIQRSG